MALWDHWAGRNGHTNGAVAEGAVSRGITFPDRGAFEESVEIAVQERIAELELSGEDVFWRPFSTEGTWEFSHQYLQRIRREARLFYLKSPLINRAVSLQAMYVFGQGVSFTAQDARVQAVVDAFLEDPANQAELTSHQARALKETELQVDGELFFVLFTARRTGAVRVRTIDPDEVLDILTNPEDAKEPWYYKRQWTPRTLDLATGVAQGALQTVYYPDWRYQPTARPPRIGDCAVRWESPVYHVKVGGFSNMRRGVSETYAAHDWAKAHRQNLEDWASIVRAYRRFAFQVKAPGGARGVAGTKAKLGTTLATGDGTMETNPPPTTGSIAVHSEGYDLQPIRTAGATVSADDSRQLKLMVAAALGLPEFFFGDADVGNHATAKTLDRPTELKFKDRQTLWADVHVDLFQYAVDRKLDATGGLGPAPTPGGDQIQPDTPQALNRTIDARFPPILQHDLGELVTAIVNAITLAGHPPISEAMLRTGMSYILNALGEDDVDAKLAELFPETEPGPPAPDLPAGVANPDPALTVPGMGGP